MKLGRIIVPLVTTALLATTAILTPAPSHADDDGPPAIEVTGRAERSAPPDIARFRVTIKSQNTQANLAAEDNARRSDAVMAALAGSVGKGGSATTEGYAVSPHYRWKDGQQILIGYQAHNSIRVEMRELDRVGGVTAAALDAGADAIENLSFTLADDAKLRAQALASASRSARMKADAIAKALDLRVVRVLRVRESGGGGTPRPVMRQSMQAMAQDSAPPPIAPGPVKVEVQVTLVLEVAE